MEATEKQVDISQQRAQPLGVNQKIKNMAVLANQENSWMIMRSRQIEAMLKKHFELCMQCIKRGDCNSILEKAMKSSISHSYT
jgi:hypothetical protein